MATIATLRDISVLLIALEVFVMLLVPGAILYFTVRALGWLRRKLRSFMPTVDHGFRQVSDIADKASQKAVAPIIAVDAFAARVRRMRSIL